MMGDQSRSKKQMASSSSHTSPKGRRSKGSSSASSPRSPPISVLDAPRALAQMSPVTTSDHPLPTVHATDFNVASHLPSTTAEVLRHVHATAALPSHPIFTEGGAFGAAAKDPKQEDDFANVDDKKKDHKHGDDGLLGGVSGGHDSKLLSGGAKGHAGRDERWYWKVHRRLVGRDQENGPRSRSGGDGGFDERDICEFYRSARHALPLSATSRHSHASENPAVSDAWRLKDRKRTVCCGLIACLNFGVDTPDAAARAAALRGPGTKMQCWVDPDTLSPAKALKAVGAALQKQYERWQRRARYRVLLDPAVDDVRKLCLSLRRYAHDERVLIHYNGHGVPQPTPLGEIWVFNKEFTQYIPLSLIDVQSWLGEESPVVYVFDCNAAGVAVDAFRRIVEGQAQEVENMRKEQDRHVGTPNRIGNQQRRELPTPIDGQAQSGQEALQFRYIMMGSCSASEMLPVYNAALPADMFTACLTTPVRMALRWLCSKSLLLRSISVDMIDRIPGLHSPNNRKTPFGELTWIFTAVTDTIAWSVLPQPLFQLLFRQDLLVASLFRNFLLAQRIMQEVHCHVVSYPELPMTHRHPMWDAWDLAADSFLVQLGKHHNEGIPMKPCTFFEEQLTSLEMWLTFASKEEGSPMRLPVLLQVLLSQGHRLRALSLLSVYMDKGSWAVDMALTVGIFPYVLKLLQSPGGDLRDVLTFIWACIIARDKSCHADLVKCHAVGYFAAQLEHDMTLNDCEEKNEQPNSASDPSKDDDSFSPLLMSPRFSRRSDLPSKPLSNAPEKLSTNGVDGLPALEETSDVDAAKHVENDEQERRYRGELRFRNQYCFPMMDLTREALYHLSNNDFQRIISAFVLATICGESALGRLELFGLRPCALELFSRHLHSADFRVRQWMCLCISKLCGAGFLPAKAQAVEIRLVEKLKQLLRDVEPEVRAAAVLAHASLLGVADESFRFHPPAAAVAPEGTEAPSGGDTQHASDSSASAVGHGRQSLLSLSIHTNEDGGSCRECLPGSVRPDPPVMAPLSEHVRSRTHMEAAMRIESVPLTSKVDYELGIGEVLADLMGDGSALVRLEVVIALSEVVYAYQDIVISVAAATSKAASSSSSAAALPLSSSKAGLSPMAPGSIGAGSISGHLKRYSRENFQRVWKLWRVLILSCRDPHTDVGTAALAVHRYVMSKIALSDRLDDMLGSGKAAHASKMAAAAAAVAAAADGSKTSANAMSTSPSLSQSSGGNIVGGAAQHAKARRSLHFNRHKMGGLRGASMNWSSGRPPAAENAVLSAEKSDMKRKSSDAARSLGGKISGASPPHAPGGGSLRRMDERSALYSRMADNHETLGGTESVLKDASWMVPPSCLFERSARLFSTPLLARTPRDVVPYIDLAAKCYFQYKVALKRETERISEPFMHSFVDRKKSGRRTDKYLETAFFEVKWAQTSVVVFHPYENMLVAASSSSVIGVWDHHLKQQVNTFRNGNRRGSRITSINIVNDLHVSLLLCGSDDGVLRMWRDAHVPGHQQLVAAWNANPLPSRNPCVVNNKRFVSAADGTMASLLGSPPKFRAGPGSLLHRTGSVPSGNASSLLLKDKERSSAIYTSSVGAAHRQVSGNQRQTSRFRHYVPPLVVDWQQRTGRVAVSGGAQHCIRIWDVLTELPVCELDSGNARVTAMHSAPETGSVLYAGGADGVVRLFDLRLPAAQAMVDVVPVSNGGAGVVSVWCQGRMSSPVFVAACADGEVLLADKRLHRGTMQRIRRTTHATKHRKGVAGRSSARNIGREFNGSGGGGGAFGTRSPAAEGGLPSFQSPSPSIRGGVGAGSTGEAVVGSSGALTPHIGTHTNSLDAAAVHDFYPTIATGSHCRFIEVFNFDGAHSTTVKYHTGFLGVRIGAVSSLAFHPHLELLAVGCLDSYISLLACRRGL